eukprot:383915_1
MNNIYVLTLAVYFFGTLQSLIWHTYNVPIPDLLFVAGAFIAYYNNTVYLLGGGKNDLTQFPLNAEWIKNVSSGNAFGIEMGWGQAQSSVQVYNFLWFAQGSGGRDEKLYVFDLAQQVITEKITVPGAVEYGNCVTYWNDYILLIGGSKQVVAQTEFHILIISNLTWLNGTNLTNGITYHSCNVISDTVYLIGGYNSGYYSNKVQYLDLNIYFNNPWNFINDTLSTGKRYHRSVVWDKNIYVIGGEIYVEQYLSQIDIIHTISKTISNPISDLIYAKEYVSAIVVDGIIYSFGGYPLENNNQYYQYAIIPPTNSPTTSPTTAPSNHPTFLPTVPPSNIPTISPTVSPIASPTIPPINVPTFSPTMAPTFAPNFGEEFNKSFSISELEKYDYLTIAIVSLIFGILIISGIVHKKKK